MEFITKLFKNSRNGQASLVLPKKQLLKALKVERVPDMVKVKITKCKCQIPKQKTSFI